MSSTTVVGGCRESCIRRKRAIPGDTHHIEGIVWPDGDRPDDLVDPTQEPSHPLLFDLVGDPVLRDDRLDDRLPPSRRRDIDDEALAGQEQP